MLNKEIWLKLKRKKVTVFSKCYAWQGWVWGVCLCWFEGAEVLKMLWGRSIGWEGQEMFHWLNCNGAVRSIGWKCKCCVHWPGGHVGASCRRPDWAGTVSFCLGCPCGLYSNSECHWTLAPTGPGPGANTIKQIRKLIHRGQKDEDRLRRKGRRTRSKGSGSCEM